MDNSDIIYVIMCYSDIISSYRLSCTSHIHYNTFNFEKCGSVQVDV